MKVKSAFLGALALLALQGCGPPLAKIDGELFPDPPADAITFWGHACCYIDLDGFGIVTDPVFEKKTLIRWRKIPIPPPAAYQHARVILISHAHPDHLSPQTLATFPDDTIILCPQPSAKYLDDLGMDVRAMRPGERFTFPGGWITAVRARHMGGRYSLSAGTDGRALGYVISSSRGRIFYSGDTNDFWGFGDVGLIYNPDVALLNINGHLHSDDAVSAAHATRARTVIPLHFGAYGYFFFGASETPRGHDKMERLLGPAYKPLRPGESFLLKRPPPSGAPLP